jgi:hypothetical protein
MARSEQQMVSMGMKPDVPFVEFPKIHRFNRTIVVTEKLDGTNAQVYISDDGDRVFAGSRNKWISVEDDNYGFARWVKDNQDELRKLGPGSHFGEWWGQGIQRRYGLAEKRFSLFNTARWNAENPPPACCHVVPLLAQGLITEVDVRAVLLSLAENGSVAAPGFMNPEGIVVYHSPSRNLYKMTLDKNDEHKGA